MRSLILISCLTLVCLACCKTLPAETPKQVAGTLDTQVRVKLNYLLYLPDDYEKDESSPLLLFLHGAGERGEDLELVKRHGPPRLIEEGKSLPFIVLSPQCTKDRWWATEVVQLTALLDEIIAKYKVDQDRIYITGLSMGGFGTWTMAAYTPRRFAAIVPICGGGDLVMTRTLAHMPIWAFHGAKDPTVPVRRSQQMIDALKKENNEVKLTIYPDALHDSWTATYNNPAVYEWLLQHKRKLVP
jgi:predicted peptidase